MSKEEHIIKYKVNDDDQTTTEKTLTPIQIMDNAKIDSSKNYLSEIKGKQQISYKNDANDPIKMHNNQKFITSFTGPTSVER